MSGSVSGGGSEGAVAPRSEERSRPGSSEAPRPGPVLSVFSSLRVRNFRFYAGGQVVSLLGTWMQRIAQDWLVLEISGGDPVALGVAIALQFAPMPLFTLWAGVLADRFDKRLLLIALQYGAGGSALTLGLLDVTGVVQLWHVYLLCLVLGCCGAVEMPVRQSFVMEIVGGDRVGNAVAVNSMIMNTCRMSGPAVAGYLITLSGTGWLFLFNAASMLAVVATLHMMDPAALRRDSTASSGRGRLREGLSYVRNRPDLIPVLTMVFFLGTFGITFNTSLAVVAGEVFGLGSFGFGMLHASLAAGTLTGAVLAAWRSSHGRPRKEVLVGSALTFGFCEALAAFLPWLIPFAAALLVIGAAQMTFILTANNTIQVSVSAEMRGRVLALYMLLLLGGTPVGSLLAGWSAEHLGPRSPLLLGGVVSFVPALVCGIVAARRGGAVRAAPPAS
ncbi:MFS family permease [Actinopolyspora biskrensis]|uniref:MFS family permease n=1 Tax=Actinopolyspora biskrensis TaxID=1470178 RepID=A0A852Z5E2_9ACTN|nr:MFS transporter [Actinopolyspora biskrensis]NYH80939.1 MFS family permease [Actinopolyspora biskrensis]